jgi:sugar lactone lactonase YvrE
MHSPLFTSVPFTPPSGFTAGIEGPACDAGGNLYAVNFHHEGTIGMITPDAECSMFVELPPGSVGNGIRFNRRGEMLVADYTGHNILKVEMQSRTVSVYAHEPKLNQPNDIAITAKDVLFASDPNWTEGSGRIWRIGSERCFCLLEDDMGTTNGIEVSPDDRILYVNESVQRRIWAYDLSPSGEISNKRLFHQFEDFGLDGMRCDNGGNLYVTRYGKGCVAKISPHGEVLHEIQLNGANCTNLTFGGPDGRTIYVTIADGGYIERFRVDLPGRLTHT